MKALLLIFRLRFTASLDCWLAPVFELNCEYKNSKVLTTFNVKEIRQNVDRVTERINPTEE